MVSRSGLYYLERKRVFDPPRPKPKFQTDTSLLHSRPVAALPQLTGPDSPAERVLSQDETERIPYLKP